MAAPVLLWCVAAVALLTTLSGATEMNKIENVPKLQFQWFDNDTIEQYQALVDSIQQNGERLKNMRLKNMRLKNMRPQELSPGQNAHEEYIKFGSLLDSFHEKMHDYYLYRLHQPHQPYQLAYESSDEESDEERHDLQGMSQDKTNALKPSIINAMPGLIILVFTLTILFLYMIRSRWKEQNVNHKD